MHKILTQLNKKTLNQKSKAQRIEEKVYLMSPRLVCELNKTKEVCK